MSDAELDARLRVLASGRSQPVTPRLPIATLPAAEMAAAAAAAHHDVDELAAQVIGLVRRDLARCFAALAVRLQEVGIKPDENPPTVSRSEASRRVKRREALETLAAYSGNKVQAARALGVTRATLYKWLTPTDPTGPA